MVQTFLEKISLYSELTRTEDQKEYLQLASLLIEQCEINEEFMTPLMKGYMKAIFREKENQNQHILTSSLTFFNTYLLKTNENTDFGHTLTYLFAFAKEHGEKISL